MTSAIQFENLTLGYDRHPAVHHLTGAIAHGGLLAIVGPNGAGKSTLLKGIVGMLSPLDGSVKLNGFAASDIAYLPQRANLDLSFPINVYDLVAMGLWRQAGAFGSLGRSARNKIAQTLDRVGLNGFAARPIGTLSGGQMQRALFARLMLQDASLILLDEPFAAIDERTTSDLTRIIRHWHDEGRTMIAVLHDLDLVRAHFPQTLILAREPVAWGATDSVLRHADHMLQARHLMEAWDDKAHVCGRDAA